MDKSIGKTSGSSHILHFHIPQMGGFFTARVCSDNLAVDFKQFLFLSGLSGCM